MTALRHAGREPCCIACPLVLFCLTTPIVRIDKCTKCWCVSLIVEHAQSTDLLFSPTYETLVYAENVRCPLAFAMKGKRFRGHACRCTEALMRDIRGVLEKHRLRGG